MLGNAGTGALLENSAALHLLRKGKLQYYAKKTGQEIDFIPDGKIAVEVKETPTLSDLGTLKNRAESIGINRFHLAELKQPGSGFNAFVWTGLLEEVF